MAGSKERNNGDKTATFVENETIEFPIIFSPRLPDLSIFSIPCIVGKLEIERAMCELGASVSIILYSLFHKLHIGPLQAASFSLQLAGGSEMQFIGRLDNA